MRIGLLSDTHGHLDDGILRALEGCDEIWHAGDFGSQAVADGLAALAPLRGVHGNVDGPELRRRFPEDLRFQCEGVRTWMIHIGGRPGRYPKAVREGLATDPPDLFVCGHSHILRVERDRGVLYVNPGACGHEGLHTVRTLVRFSLEEGAVGRMEAVELGLRGR